MSKIFTTFIILLATSGLGFAAGGQLSQESNVIFGSREGFAITNSMIMVWIATFVIVLFCRAATKKIAIVPVGFQNFAEWVIESLYNFFEGILGEHLVKKTFWFFGGTFLVILITNWLALIPGVGTLWFGLGGSLQPLLRGGNADVNVTAAMSVVFALLWFYWAIKENGLNGFLSHIFAPKGDFSGVMRFGMILIFFVVGILEIVSIFIRPIALSFRLYGNTFGGEQVLETLMSMGGEKLAFLPALPFMFMELLVGLLQALVFTILSAVFLKLICEHHDDEHAH